MKLIHRLSLFIIVALAALPLVIMAQDNGQPPAPGNGVSIAQVLTTEPEDIPLPGPSPTLDIQPARSPTPELIEYPTATLDIRPAQTATLELYDYPTSVPGNPCAEPPPPAGSFEALEYDMFCPPTVTPRPRPTTEATTAIINGLWVLDPNASTFSSNGQCQIEGGDNGGMGGDYQPEELPKVPVCMTADNQWLTVDNGGTYPLVLANYYSQQEMSRELLYTNGATSGSLDINTTRQYHVISPTEIEFSYIRNEKGGCTTNSSVRYKLVEANELVCKGVVMTPDYTPVPTQMPTPKPGETQQPPITPEPPIQIGEYIIQLPPVDDTCTTDNMPTSDNLNVSYDDNQNLFINFGGGSYTLYWNGSDYYSYSQGNRFDISMATYPGGASFMWNKEGCFVSGPLTREGTPTATPVPVEPTRTPYADAAAIAGSSFSVTSDAPAYLCAEENKDMLPDLSGAILTAEADGSFAFSVGGKDYTLTNSNGIHGLTEVNGDGSMLAITMNGFYEGNGMGTYMVVSSNGKSCIAQLTFTPKG